MSGYSEGFLERQEAIYKELVEKTDPACSTYPIVLKMWERYRDALKARDSEN